MLHEFGLCLGSLCIRPEHVTYSGPNPLQTGLAQCGAVIIILFVFIASICTVKYKPSG